MDDIPDADRHDADRQADRHDVDRSGVDGIGSAGVEPNQPESVHKRPPGRPDEVEPNALDSVRDAFACLVRGPDPLSIEGRLFPRLPDRRMRLDHVGRRLLSRGCRQATRDAVWAHVVLRARTDAPAWKVGAAGMALPALVSVTADLHGRFGGDCGDVAGDVLAGFLDGLESVDVTRPGIMIRLRWSAYRAAHGPLLATVRAPLYGELQEEDLDGLTRMTSAFESTPPRPPYGHPDLVLAQGVADGVLNRREADLIGTTRLDRVRMQDWADDHATTLWAAYQARRRAEQRLIGYLLDPVDQRRQVRHVSSACRCSSREAARRCSAGRCRPGRSRNLETRMSKTGPGSGLQSQSTRPALNRPHRQRRSGRPDGPAATGTPAKHRPTASPGTFDRTGDTTCD